MKPDEASSEAVVRLAEVLDLAAASGLTEELSTARGADVVLDAASVRHVGGQCAQVLLAAKQAWQADGHKLGIVNATAPFQQGIGLLGLAEDFALEGA
jgi:chemotaxis protein CheX